MNFQYSIEKFFCSYRFSSSFVSSTIGFFVVDYNNFVSCLSKNRNISEEIQLILTMKGGVSARMSLADNPSISGRTQLALIKYDCNYTKYYLAGNLNISKEVQLVLAKDIDLTIRYKLAGNPNISYKIQLILSDDSGFVRGYLRGNKGLYKNIRKILNA